MLLQYNVELIGAPGGGGEYGVQLGFGWTNGVALRFLTDYGDRLVSPTLTPTTRSSTTGVTRSSTKGATSGAWGASGGRWIMVAIALVIKMLN